MRRRRLLRTESMRPLTGEASCFEKMAALRASQYQHLVASAPGPCPVTAVAMGHLRLPKAWRRHGHLHGDDAVGMRGKVGANAELSGMIKVFHYTL
jgi:hypothetical protein